MDGNQAALVAALRRIPGVSCAVTSSLGGGFPDLVVGHRGRTYLFEVKDPAQPPSARALTTAEQTFEQSWGGHYAVVLTLEDCLRAMGIVS